MYLAQAIFCSLEDQIIQLITFHPMILTLRSLDSHQQCYSLQVGNQYLNYLTIEFYKIKSSSKYLL